ncbi:MAG: hypothetical protein ACKO5K_12415 [Armatimonadota bacterium]
MRHIEPLIPIEFPKILVPVDCTPSAQMQATAAAAFAYPLSGVRMTVLAQRPVLANAPVQVVDAAKRHADDALAAAANVLSGVGTYCVRTSREADSLPRAIVDELKEGKYQMLMLTASYANRPMDEESACAQTWGAWLAERIRIPIVVAPEFR